MQVSKMNSYIHNYIYKYFTEYLPKECGLLKNSIISYKYALTIFLKYLQKERNININNFEIININKELILNFLDYLTENKNNSLATKQNRLNAIISFCKYLYSKEIIFLENYTEIAKITITKATHEITEYLTKDELKQLLQRIEIETKKGARDYCLISLIYDSGARVSEIIHLKTSNINLNTNTILLHGKGNKTRINPISSNVVEMLKQYIEKYDINIEKESYLFFNNRGDTLTKEGIKYIIQKYLPENVKKKSHLIL